MSKKLLLLGMIFIIFILSSTSSLRVVRPSTWSNETIYNQNADWKDVFDGQSRFYDGYFPTKNGIFHADINFFAHKMSHITAYSVLALLFLINLRRFRNPRILSLFGVILIAILDEINQYMVVGRTGLMLDVMVDTMAASLVLVLSYYLRKKVKS